LYLNHLLRLPVVELAHYNWVLGIIKAVDRSELVLNLSFDNLLLTYVFIPEDERVDVLVTHPTVIFAAVLFITIL
jgi:Mg2+/Co2+ transporter CorC